MTNETNTPRIEVRIIERHYGQVCESATYPTLYAASQGIEPLLAEACDAAGHEPSVSAPRWCHWVPASPDSFEVVVVVNGKEFTPEEIGCVECGCPVDDREGWEIFTDATHVEPSCPTCAPYTAARWAGAERRIA